jgi:hypothetical protein
LLTSTVTSRKCCESPIEAQVFFSRFWLSFMFSRVQRSERCPQRIRSWQCLCPHARGNRGSILVTAKATAELGGNSLLNANEPPSRTWRVHLN